MKKLILIASCVSFSFSANAVDVSTLANLKIMPVETLQTQQKTVTLNGQKYAKKLAATPKQAKQLKQQKVNSNTIDLPNVISGEVLYSEDGFFEYRVTGEVIVKLTGDVDFTEFNQRHNLTITQAYKNYYVLKGAAEKNLLSVVDELVALPNVASATIDIVDKNVSHY